MSETISSDIARGLVINKALSSQLIQHAFELATPIAKGCAGQNVLVRIPLRTVAVEPEIDVVIRLSDFAQFRRTLKAYQENRIRYEIRRMCPDFIDAGESRDETLFDESGKIPRGIFGFVGRYGVICIRRHEHLDCIVVQFS